MNLTQTAAWYELVWLAVMALGALCNGGILYQTLADRAAFRREVGRAAWRNDPLRIVTRQQVRTASLSLLAQIGGAGVGIVAALTPPSTPAVASRLNATGVMITVYLIVLATILAVKPLLNLIDNRRLYGIAARARVRAGIDAEARRQATVENLVGLLFVLFTLALVAYAAVLYNDMLLQARQGTIPDLTPARYFGQLFRTVLTTAMTATLTGLVIGTLVGAFYRIRGE